MLQLCPYRRQDAVDYAHVWAYGRTPLYYDFSEIGGDCTNYASQCIYAGTGVMNYTPTFGWYYINVDDRAPAWTGVEFLHNFLARNEVSVGPVAAISKNLTAAQIGDIIQLRFRADVFEHSPIVVSTDQSGDPAKILVAAHSNDADCRPLSTYQYTEFRVLHILGYYCEMETGSEE